jgi:AAA+ superfamily predicted ATPase
MKFGSSKNANQWELFADEILRFGIVKQGPVGDDLAKQGLLLPGFKSRDALEKETDKNLSSAWKMLESEMSSKSLFATAIRLARADKHDAALIAVLSAVEIRPERRRVVAGLGGKTDGTVTLGVLSHVLPESLTAAAPDSRLMRSGFIHVSESGAWAAREIHLAPSLVWSLLGVQDRDPELPIDIEHISGVAGSGDAQVILVAGPDRSARRRRALMRLGAERAIALKGTDESTNWAAVVREATLCGAAVLVDVVDSVPPRIKWWIERANHLRWGILSENQIPLEQLPDRAWVDDQISDRVASAASVLQQMGGALGAGHRLTFTQLDQIRKSLPALGGDPSHAARRLVTGDLDRLTTRIRPSRSWDDLVLPVEDFERVRMVAARYRHRDTVLDEWGFKPIPSAGVVAMFSGPPGTGKTMSAEVIAADLGLDLFKVNLATMVSKYIGETEKNLEQLFDVADTGNVVLLFDEADSIFGKRSEVSDAQDRYANLEVSYLLQRIERFDGLVILTTNLSSNIDNAFLRRIHVVVDFQAPDEGERRTLWLKALPNDAPQNEVDIDFCARFKLSGADIRSVSLGAAFMAADEKKSISMSHVVTALFDEMRKQGRLVDRGSFEPYADLLPAEGPIRRS